jgi:hypothetical protein
MWRRAPSEVHSSAGLEKCAKAFRCGPCPAASTAVNPNELSRGFKITHPFHPWSGGEFEIVTYLHTWGEDRVYFHKEGDRLVSVPASWTDVVPEDPVVKLAAGRSLLRVEDLVELVGLVERLRGETPGPQSVKVIMP